MDFLKVRLWKRLWIAWSKTVESFVNKIDVQEFHFWTLSLSILRKTTTTLCLSECKVSLLKALDKVPVGSLDDLLNGLELLYDLNWTEDLLPTDLHLISDVTINIMAWMEESQNGRQDTGPGPEHIAGYDTTRLGTILCNKVEDQKIYHRWAR